MKRLSSILSIVTLMALLAGIVLAQEVTGKTDKGADQAFEKSLSKMGKTEASAPVSRFRAMRGRGMVGPGWMNMSERGGRMGRVGRGPHRSMMMDQMGILIRLADKLDLSEEQKAELKDLATSHRKDVIRMKADREIAEVELQESIRQEEPDLDAIEDQIRGIANLEAQMKFSQIKARVDARSVLTEEQQEKLKELLKNRPAGRQDRSGKPGTDRPGLEHGRAMRRG